MGVAAAGSVRNGFAGRALPLAAGRVAGFPPGARFAARTGFLAAVFFCLGGAAFAAPFPAPFAGSFRAPFERCGRFGPLAWRFAIV